MDVLRERERESAWLGTLLDSNQEDFAFGELWAKMLRHANNIYKTTKLILMLTFY